MCGELKSMLKRTEVLASALSIPRGMGKAGSSVSSALPGGATTIHNLFGHLLFSPEMNGTFCEVNIGR